VGAFRFLIWIRGRAPKLWTAQIAMVTNANKVNNGQMPVLPKSKVQSPDETDFYSVRADEPDIVLSAVSCERWDWTESSFGAREQ
jgi:hypothetical protein